MKDWPLSAMPSVLPTNTLIDNSHVRDKDTPVLYDRSSATSFTDQRRPGGGSRFRAYLEYLELCRIMDQYEPVHSNVHAGQLPDRGWHELVAIDLTIFLGNAIVLVPMILNGHAGAKYGIPFPCFCQGQLWHKRRQYSCHTPGDRCLRLVWHSNMDRGFALYQMLRLWIPALETLPPFFPTISGWHPGPAFVFLFWLLNMYVVYLGWTISKTTAV